jgi:small subunit ribosomal protein S3
MKEKKFARFGVVKTLIKEVIMDEFKRASVTDVDVIKTPISTRIVITAARPGLILGNRRKLRDVLRKISRRWRINNPQIEVKDLENPFLVPEFVTKLMAVKIAKGNNPKRVLYTTIRRVMDAGAKGCEIYAKGSFRRGMQNIKYRVQAGHIKKSGDPAENILEDMRQVQLGHGVIGVCVRIVPSDYKFPDQIEVPEPIIIEEESDEYGNNENQ